MQNDQLEQQEPPGRDEPRWVPYSPPPPQNTGERVTAALQNHGFTAVFILILAGLVGALFWSSAESNQLGEASAQNQPARERQQPTRPAGTNPYAGQATLSVTSRPEGATVYLGGDTLGVTPVANRSVPAGVHLVTIEKDGHSTADSVLVVRSDRPNTLRVVLRGTPTAARGGALAGTSGAPEAPAGQAEREARSEVARSEAARREAERAAQRQAARDAAAAEARRQERTYARAMQEGNDRFVEGDYVEARRAYEAALTIRPNDTKAQERLQRTEARLVEEEEAQAQYQYYRARGDILFEEERYQEAVGAYRQALTYRAGDAYVQSRLTRSKAEARIALDEAAEAAEAARPAEAETRRPFIAPDLPENEEAPARLNLNTATASQLERLPGIGPKLSQRIVEDRNRSGPFRSVRDITRVRGIGPKTLEAISNLVFVQE